MKEAQSRMKPNKIQQTFKKKDLCEHFKTTFLSLNILKNRFFKHTLFLIQWKNNEQILCVYKHQEKLCRTLMKFDKICLMGTYHKLQKAQSAMK